MEIPELIMIVDLYCIRGYWPEVRIVYRWLKWKYEIDNWILCKFSLVFILMMILYFYFIEKFSFHLILGFKPKNFQSSLFPLETAKSANSKVISVLLYEQWWYKFLMFIVSAKFESTSTKNVSLGSVDRITWHQAPM